MLQLHNVRKNYAEQQALSNVSLTIAGNEMVGLIGLNGSGKTSLLKCLLDLQAVSSGDIRINAGSHLNKTARENLVYLPEKFMPPDYMSGREYLQWMHDAHRLRLEKSELAARVNALLEQVELDKAALKKPVKTYSKGMLQKLGIIGCLLSGKDLLILDEPMSGLDPKARVLFQKIVLELKQAGKTVLLCTHILSDIEQLCDRVGILHQGQLLFVGSPQDCCVQYQAQSLEQAFLNAIEN